MYMYTCEHRFKETTVNKQNNKNKNKKKTNANHPELFIKLRFENQSICMSAFILIVFHNILHKLRTLYTE